jgi:hypothetical protein
MRKILRRSREERKYLLFGGQDGTSEVSKVVAVPAGYGKIEDFRPILEKEVEVMDDEQRRVRY